MRYGDQVEVAYWDLSQPAAQAQHPHILAAIQEQDLSYPVVMVEGEIRLTGSVHYHELVPLVEAVLGQEVSA
jgi:disulfide oxidoreductase YuzD